MNSDAFSFFNDQLAHALRSGIPLEGALHHLAATLGKGRLRTEIEKLEADLASGLPLEQALTGRKFPELYVQVLKVGARSNDLPGFLTLLADYYRSVFEMGGRLKALMIYPGIVLLCSLALSCWFAFVFRALPEAVDLPSAFDRNAPALANLSGPRIQAWLSMWAPPVAMSVLAVLAGAVVGTPAGRKYLKWHMPAFREASLSQLAQVIGLLVRSGVPLPDALQLIERVEGSGRVKEELARWRQRLGEGHGRFESMTAGSRLIPPLFSWLVGSSGEDLATGLFRAAEVYAQRAALRAEMLLNAVLPSSLLLLGLMLLCQIHPFTATIYHLLSDLGRVFKP